MSNNKKELLNKLEKAFQEKKFDIARNLLEKNQLKNVDLETLNLISITDNNACYNVIKNFI